MDEKEENGKPSQWGKTAASLLAGIASLLTAITGLMIAAHQLGYLKGLEAAINPSSSQRGLLDGVDGGDSQTGSPFFMVRLIGPKDLAGLSSSELDLLRNEIYARHGRRFSRKDLQSHFDHQSWYRPLYAPDEFPSNLLTEIQRKNVEIISAYQQRMQR
jgi:hypothetical protein